MSKFAQMREPDLVIDLSDIAGSVKKNVGLDDYFYIKEYRERKQFLTDTIDSMSVEDVCKAIMQYNKDDYGLDPEQRKPITLYLDTPGGEVSAGLKLIDTIQASKTPVHIVNMGSCFSMGFMIYVAGHRRVASRNAIFLMHDGSIDASGTTSKTRDLMEFSDRLDGRLKNLVLAMTKIPAELYDEKARKEWYMFAEEAKELGVVDEIIGVDCEMDDVI